MAETMEQYMSKTRADYGSGVARFKIEDKYNFELKGKFLKKLRDNTFSGSDHEDENKHIEKVLEIVDLSHIPNITIDQVMLRAVPMSLTGAASRWLRNKPSEMQEVVLFYNGLDVPTRHILDSRGAIPSKTVVDAKKVDEKVYAAQVGCEQCKGPHYTKDCPLKEEGKTLEEAYYTQFGAPFQGGGYRATALGFYQRNNMNPSYQERRQFMKDTLSKFMSESEKQHEENSKLIKEIRASTDDAIRNQGASIKTLEIQIGQMSKVLQERGFECLPTSTETNSRDHVKSISTIVETDSRLIRRMESSQYVISTGQNHTLMYEIKRMTILFLCRFNGYYCEEKKGSYGPQFSKAYSKASHINNFIPRKEKDPGSFTLSCFINNIFFDNALVDLGASVSVMPLSTYLNLGLGELAHTKLTVELVDRTVKYPKGIAENVLVSIGKFVFPVDFIILDMPEDIKVPLILERPFLSTARAKIDVFKRKITLRVGEEQIIFKCIKPASSLIKRVYVLSLRERIELDSEARLMGETLVLNRSLDYFFEDYIELNDLNIPLELRRDQVDDLMPTIKEDFAVLEDTDAYHDKGMSDVIFGEPFLREVGINEKQFEGMITIHNGNEEVTYQMVRSHPRFKHHTNEQCNKIPPLLKDLAERKEIDNVGGESTI
ncbi:hypothetical protein Tco_0158827 [Tanacetum coccineum]